MKSEDKSFAGVRDALILELLYSTGIRQSELLDLCEEDIDFIANEIRILGKRRKERLIPVHSEIMQRIKHYIDFPESKYLAEAANIFKHADNFVKKKKLNISEEE